MSISKELLSEVLEEDIVEVGSFNSPILEINVQRYSYKEWQRINIYEFAFLTRNYLHKKYGYSLDMSLEIGEIFKNATQFYESML